MRRPIVLALVACAFLRSVQAQTVEIPPSTEAGKMIQSLIEAGSMAELRWPDFSDYRKHLRNFYAPAGYELAWTHDGQPTSQALTVIELLQAADAKGIHAVDYDGPRWPARLKSIDPGRFDLALTVALMRYISDLHIGRVNPRNVRFELDIEHKKYYLPDLVAQVKGSGAPALLLSTIEPPYEEYKRLQAALATYRKLEPLSRHVKQIEWALERWRWVPMEFATPPIIVNVPEFRLRAWGDDGKTALTMRVVVGQTYGHQTPIFSGDLQYVVFRPYWYVTPNIQRSELVPKVEKDRAYLARNDYEVIDANDTPITGKIDDDALNKLRAGDYRVRQKPGPSNALGLVKFMFPNQNNVYLHSTPSQTLFAKSRRDFSHGCIRVEEPEALAAWVLREFPEWTAERIHAAMNGKDSSQANLKHPIPVLILYATAHVTDEGEVQFFEDIYGHDATLENALAGGYPYPP